MRYITIIFTWVTLLVFCAPELEAALKVLSMQLGTPNADCSCTNPGASCTSAVEKGFVNGEICASRFDPDPGDYPLRVTKVYALFGPTGWGYNYFDLIIWEDDGINVNPGKVLYVNSFMVTGNESLCYEFDLGSEPFPVCFNDPSKKIRVGFLYDHVGYPGNFRDLEQHHPRQNYIFAHMTTYQWFYSEDLYVPGDWLIEVEIDTQSPDCGGPTTTPTPTGTWYSPTPTVTPTYSPSPTLTSTFTHTPTGTWYSPTPTVTPTMTLTPTPTGTWFTATPTPTGTWFTATPTFTITPTMTPVKPPSYVMLNKDNYCTTMDSAIITVFDTDLNTDPLSKQNVIVHVITNSDTTGIDMILTETSNSSDLFTSEVSGTNLRFSLSGSSELFGIIQVNNGDIVGVSYNDVSPPANRTYISQWWLSEEPCYTPSPTPIPVFSQQGKYVLLLIIGCLIFILYTWLPRIKFSK